MIRREFAVLMHDGKFVDEIDNGNITYSDVPLLAHKDITLDFFIKNLEEEKSKNSENIDVVKDIVKTFTFEKCLLIVKDEEFEKRFEKFREELLKQNLFIYMVNDAEYEMFNLGSVDLKEVIEMFQYFTFSGIEDKMICNGCTITMYFVSHNNKRTKLTLISPIIDGK